MRDPHLRLTDILEAILAIEMYTQGGREEFESSDLIQSWVILHLQNIGEAADGLRKLKPGWLESHTEVPWDEIIGLRHRLVHGYFDIRLDLVWDAVQQGLPDLKRAITELLDSSQ